jgi:hypothetical protein
MSVISRIFNSYKEALHHSQERYESAYSSNAQAALQFYDDFLNQLFIRYGQTFSNSYLLNQIIAQAERYFQRRDINFVAIDGTCSRDPFNDFMVFFAAAYGVKGCIHIDSQPVKLRYERWSMDQDVSLVAYVPVPYAEAGDITDQGYREEFIVDDNAKINLSSIHTRLMQLSEIYLAYQMVKSSAIDGPKLVLMDLSLSSVLMSTDVGIENIRLFGCPIGSRRLGRRDGLIAYSHPINSQLSVPSTKRYRRWTYLVREFASNGGHPIDINELASNTHISRDEWEESLGLMAREPQRHYAQQIVKVEEGRISPLFDFQASWFDSVRLFEDFCDRLFHRRDPEALIYQVGEGADTRYRWMSPEDISFLASIGLRALIETCWERGVMLLSIAKDSSSRYFSRHFVGVMRQVGVFPQVQVGSLPWTDRVLLESLACQLDDLIAPWTVTEFDSAYMTLHVEEGGGQKIIRGVRGNIVNPEHLFARSLAQFFHQKKKPTPLMGHVIFIDRLLDPYWDIGFLGGGPQVSNLELGAITPAYFGDNQSLNYGQAVSVWLLSVLTRNLFPEVIGYPDPLHKADWGAKSVKERVDRLIKSSEIAFRARPLTRLFRTLRDAQGR